MFVKDTTGGGSEELCGTMAVTTVATVEGQTYELDCWGKLGNEVKTENSPHFELIIAIIVIRWSLFSHSLCPLAHRWPLVTSLRARAGWAKRSPTSGACAGSTK